SLPADDVDRLAGGFTGVGDSPEAGFAVDQERRFPRCNKLQAIVPFFKKHRFPVSSPFRLIVPGHNLRSAQDLVNLENITESASPARV
ncbi:MAG TPA: hypothetical protein VGA63_14635, partial [Geopsychrobacteraceae bacterium]